MKSNILLSIVFLLGITGIAAAQNLPLGATQVKGYMLGPGDEISGMVLGEKDYTFVATVNEDGKIELPFSDKPVLAQCRTEGELRSDIITILKKDLRNPQLSLRVTERKSRPPVGIYGAVVAPQQVVLTRRAHLLELLSFSGGPSEKSGGLIQVFRPKPPMSAEAGNDLDWKVDKAGTLDVPSRTFNYGSLSQGNNDANPEIIPGDIIVVQKADPVFVTGEVIRPGEISMPAGGLRLMQALAMSSGITREAKTKAIKVYRRKTGSPEPEVISVNYDSIRAGKDNDVLLQPYDIVEVGKASKKFSEYLLEFATGVPNRIPIRPF